MKGWRQQWDYRQPTQGDPDFSDYVVAQKLERPRLAALAAATLAPGEPDELVHTPTPLALYLDDLEQFLVRYVAFPSEHEAIAIALWVAHAHVVERFDVSPILAVTSAEMRSGKTRVLDCLELVTPAPWRVVIPSEAIAYTVLSQRPRRTMLLDEADAIFGARVADKYEGLRAVLNAGNRKGTPVSRVKLKGATREAEDFDVFGPKAIAGIGKLPDTVADRSIPIQMRRRAPDELVAKFRQRRARALAEEIRFDWELLEQLITEPAVPDELNDRAADSWEPLLAIADAARGQWPARGRLAAMALSSEDDGQVSVGIRLLGDIREAFLGTDHMATGELLERLHDFEDAPWGDWYGKPLTARGLARLLEPYRVAPVKRRLGGDQHRGYFRSDFTDAWERYVPAPTTVPSVPSVSAQPGGTDGTVGTSAEAGSFDPEFANDGDAEGVLA